MEQFNLEKFKNYDPKIFKKMMYIAEQYFGTTNDPDQIPINLESTKKLFGLNENSILYKLDKKGEPISWIVVLPTNKELMHKFLKGEITEKDLLDKTNPESVYSALYAASAFTVPEAREKGHLKELAEKAASLIPLTKDAEIFAWPFSKEGEELLKTLEKKFNRKILIKSGII